MSLMKKREKANSAVVVPAIKSAPKRKIQAQLRIIDRANRKVEWAQKQISALLRQMPDDEQTPPTLARHIAAEIRRERRNNDEPADPWTDLVLAWAGNPQMRRPVDHPLKSVGIGQGEKPRVYLREILEQAIEGLEWADHGQKVRVGVILRDAGWRKRREGYQRHGGQREEYYLPPSPPGPKGTPRT